MAKIISNIGSAGSDWLDDLEDEVDKAITRSMQKTAFVGESRVKGIMEREAHDTGRLLRSVTSSIVKVGDSMKLRIGSNLEYAFAVEHGRKPGKWPRLDSLVKWVGRKLRAKGINTKVNVTYDELKRLAKVTGKKATAQQKAFRQHLQATYLIGRKIATKGIREKLIFKRVEAPLLTYFRKNLQKELQSMQ